jgi:hypothetical protein
MSVRRGCRHRGVGVLVALVALVGVWLGDAAAASKPPPLKARLVRILTPVRDAILTGSTVPVTIALPSGTRSVHVTVQLRDVTRRFHVHRNRATAVLPARLFGAGANGIVVRVRTGRAWAETHVRVYAGRTRRSLLRVTVSSYAPLSVSVRGPIRDSVFYAVLNGRDVTREFKRVSLQRRTATLSVAEGLRRGHNVLRFAIARRSTGAHVAIVRSFTIGPKIVLAAMARGHSALIGSALRLDASPSLGVGRKPRLSFRWVLVSRPRGSHARFSKANRARPRLVPDKPGRYVVRLEVRQRLARAATASRLKMRQRLARASTAGGSAAKSVLTRTYEVAPVMSPFGEPIQTIAPSAGGYAVQIGSQMIPNTAGTHGYFVLIIDRGTGTVVNGNGNGTAIPYGQETSLQSLISSSSSDDLVVVAAAPSGAAPVNVGTTQINAFNAAMGDIGASVPTSSIGPGGFSVIGIPDAPAGSAWQNVGGDHTLYGHPAQITGTLDGRLLPDSNSVLSTSASSTSIELTFAFTDYVVFDTARTNGSETGISLSTPHPVFSPVTPSDGPGGFQVAVLDPHFLGPTATANFCTDSTCPNENMNEYEMSNFLQQYDNGSQIIVIQSYGTVAPNADRGQGALADDIRAMGGDPDLFNSFQGSYAFVFCPGHAPSELSGNSPTDTTAAFNGLFARDNQDRFYEAQIGLGSSVPNVQIPIIANAAPVGFAFQNQPWLPATEGWIESHLDNFGVDNTYCPNNDCLRALYWTDNKVLDFGGQAEAIKSIPEPSPSTFGCDPTTTNCGQRWTNITDEFSNEFVYVSDITNLFSDWQSTIPEESSTAGLDLAALTDEIQSFIGKDQSSSGSKATEILSAISGISSALSSLGAIAGVSSAGVGAAISVPFGLLAGGASTAAAFTTNTDGYPALQGQVLASSATLGTTVAAQFDALYSSLDTLEALLLSDGGKLNAVGSQIQASAPAWTYGATSPSVTLDAVRLAMRRYIYLNLYRSFVAPANASHPKYPAYCAELGPADEQAILGSDTAYGGPGTNHAPHYHSTDAWYTFLMTYAQNGGESPLGVTEAGNLPDTTLGYPAGSSLFDTTGTNSTGIPASQFAYSGQPTNVGSPSQLFMTPVADPYVVPSSQTQPDSGGLGFNVSQFYWFVFQPYGTYTSSILHTVGTC